MKDGGIPRIGFGTWQLTGAAATSAVVSAIEVGYRHIDTAQGYGNEREVGAAVARAGVPREQLFITTKVPPEAFHEFLPSLRRSLEDLRTDQVDLTLIHWPSPGEKVPLKGYVEDLARAQDEGLTRLIGVSNFTIDLIDRATAILGGRPLATNQVEAHVYLQNRRLAAHCAGLGIGLTAYLPLAKGRVADDPALARIAAAHGAEASQVGLAYLIELGYVVIPKSADPARQRSNLATGSLKLTAADMAAIAKLDAGRRFIDPAWGPKWD
jgi:2,5-diketo-D-gluconate reductase B